LAVAKLVYSGKLRLDKKLSEYLPELKNRIENADRITLKMMVQHRSGIPNFTDSYNYWVNPKENDDENLALIMNYPAAEQRGILKQS
jgi:CubicO group peptidase (beta-lactamase class C family)